MGKLSATELQTIILDKLKKTRSEVVLSAAQGEDCAAVKTDGFLLLSGDPITAQMPLKSLGELVVNVCCNDVLANGGEPFALMLTVIMPPDSTTEDVETLMSAAAAKAESLQVDIIGGHTEFSDCVVRPVVSGTAIGRAHKVFPKSDLAVGDRLYVTKTLGIEGTTIIADGGREKLTDDDNETIRQYRESLSVLAEGRILRQCEAVSVMHDITEGGVIGAVAEICLGCGKGARIYEERFPVSGLTSRLCEKYGIQVGRMLSSGSMLFAAKDDSAAQALRREKIAVTQIGQVTTGDVLLVSKDNRERTVVPEPDEIYKFLKECGA